MGTDGSAEFRQPAALQITPENVRFRRGADGTLELALHDGRCCRSVRIVRCFPLSNADHNQHVSVQDGDGREIGLIDAIDDFPSEQAALLRFELSARYFAPIVRRIVAIERKRGHIAVVVETDVGNHRFAAKENADAVRELAGGKLIITGSSGTRYRFPSLQTEDLRYRRYLERLM